MNRSDLAEPLGLSVNQASADLNRCVGFAPENVVCDKGARTYIRGSGFKSQRLAAAADCCLARLRSVSGGILNREDSWIADLPPYASRRPSEGAIL